MATWNEVLANPEYQKLSPQDKEFARKEYFDEVVAPKVPKEQLTAARQEFDKDTGPKQQAIGTGAKTQPWQYTVGEALRQGLTSAAGAIAGGYRALGGAVAGDPNSGEKGQALAQKMTYQPQSEVAKAAVETAAIPGTKIAEGADVVGRNVAEATGSPVLGAATNTTLQAAGQILLGKGAGIVGEATGVTKALGGVTTRGGVTARVAARTAPPIDVAKDFATNKLGMNWDEVPPGIQKKLRTAARDPAELNKLDAEHVKAEIRAERLDNMPILRGQVTRDPAQLASENILAKVPKSPISAIKAVQDEKLHTGVDKVRESTGATAKTRQDVGTSVQDEGLRAKEKASQENYDKLFATARQTEPEAAVSAQPLLDLVAKKPHLQKLGFVESWLKKANAVTEREGPRRPIDLSTDVTGAKKRVEGPAYTEVRNIPLAELEELRKDASGVAAKGGSEAYYAHEVVNAIDKMFEQVPAAAKAWRAARDAFKAHKVEFEDQRIVRDLVGDATRTDRTTDLADTTGKVLSKSAEDIGKLHRTLTTGGTAATRAAGEQAWKNLQAGVIDFLREKAHGRRVNLNQNRKEEFNVGFMGAFEELEADGKIDVIFDKKQAAKLREIYETVSDTRSDPKSRATGSDTAQNLAAQQAENTLSKLEAFSKLPVVGKLSGAVSLARKVWDAGAETRRVAHAKTTPLTEAAETARKNRAKADKRRNRFKPPLPKKSQNTLKALPTAASAAGRMTLQDQTSERQ